MHEYYLVFGLLGSWAFLGLWKLNSSGFELLSFPEAAKWCALQRYLLERKGERQEDGGELREKEGARWLLSDAAQEEGSRVTWPHKIGERAFW